MCKKKNMFVPQTTKELIIDDKVEQLISDENSVQVSYEPQNDYYYSYFTGSLENSTL